MKIDLFHLVSDINYKVFILVFYMKKEWHVIEKLKKVFPFIMLTFVYVGIIVIGITYH
jgi:hypothetical protein